MENKIEFTPEQQEKVNQLIQEAQGRAAKELKDQLGKTTGELDSLKTQLAELQKQGKPKVPDEASQDLENKLREAERLIQSFQQEINGLKTIAKEKETEAMSAKEKQEQFQKLWALEKAADSGRFIDLSLVIKDTQDQVRYDETYKRYVVLNSEGHPRMNKSMEPMTLEEFYEEYATKKPWAVNPSFKGGAGSTKSNGPGGKYKLEEVFGAKSDAKKAVALMQENPTLYRAMKLQAKENGLL